MATRKSSSAFDKHWHLAKTDHEIAVTELEYSLLRVFEAFSRWQAECLAASLGKSMSGPDNAVLHVIRMNSRPKGITEIARLLNRDDIANIQYTIRKLIKAGLIERIGSKGRRAAQYQATKLGVEVTERFAELRRNLLLSLTQSVANWEEELNDAGRTLNLLTGIYDQAARVAATHRVPSDSDGK